MRSEILFSITTCGLSCSLGYKTESPPGSWLNCSTSLKRLFYIIFSPFHRIIFHDQQTECIKQAVTSELFFIWSGKTRTLPLIPDIVDSKLEATYDCGEAAWTLLDCFSLKLRNGNKWINSVGTTYVNARDQYTYEFLSTEGLSLMSIWCAGSRVSPSFLIVDLLSRSCCTSRSNCWIYLLINDNTLIKCKWRKMIFQE